MKKIEEKALAYSEQVVNDTPFDVINGKVCVWQEDTDICEVARQAYIKGATDQQKIDIDKACSCLSLYLLKYGMLISECDVLVEKFRKSMDE